MGKVSAALRFVRQAVALLVCACACAAVLAGCEASVSGAHHSSSSAAASSSVASSNQASHSSSEPASTQQAASSVPSSASEPAPVPEMPPVPEGEVLEVRFLDVGQGDCALLSCGGHHALIDGGAAAESQKVFTVLRNLGVESLDFVIATHADADHIGGIPAALRQAPCAVCYTSVLEDETETFATLKRYVEGCGASLVVPAIPTQLELGSARLSIIGPAGSFDADNDSSLVCRLVFGQTALLFMGDAEEAAERALVASGVELHADVLKVGHHGSANSTSAALVRAVHPTAAVISVGADNGYGHPTARVLKTLEEAGALIYRTDQMGDVVATSDGQQILFSTGAKRATQQSAPEAEGEPSAVAPPSGGDAASAGTTDEAAAAAAEGYKYVSMKRFMDALPEGTVYIGNVRGERFHLLDCPSVKAMKGENAVALASVDDAYARGLSPCGRCRPS